MKTDELIGAALDWAVAKCEGVDFSRGGKFNAVNNFLAGRITGGWKPSTNWAQGGPIIEREGILIAPPPSNAPLDERWWYAQKDRENGPTAFWCGKGKTPLEAAMRCYVESKFGDEVEVPEGV